MTRAEVLEAIREIMERPAEGVPDWTNAPEWALYGAWVMGRWRYVDETLRGYAPDGSLVLSVSPQSPLRRRPVN